MAEIVEAGGGKGKGDGKVRAKKLSTRVDMTPMVDLGFLLITFFMLATTLSKPSSMTLNVPDKSDKEEIKTEPLKASKVLTIFLGRNDDVHLLDGVAADDEEAKAKLKTVRFGLPLRQAILESKNRINAQNPKDEQGNDPFVVVLKPTEVSTYKNMVDLLDEMAITKTKRYALVDVLTDTEKELLGDLVTPK